MAWIKAALLLTSVFLWWAFFVVVMSPLQVPVTFLAFVSKSSRIKRYNYGLWIGQDNLVNAIHRGNHDISISSKVGYMAREGSQTAIQMAKVIDWLFYVTIGQENHCLVSIEKDEQHYKFGKEL